MASFLNSLFGKTDKTESTVPLKSRKATEMSRSVQKLDTAGRRTVRLPREVFDTSASVPAGKQLLQPAAGDHRFIFNRFSNIPGAFCYRASLPAMKKTDGSSAAEKHSLLRKGPSKSGRTSNGRRDETGLLTFAGAKEKGRETKRNTPNAKFI